MVDKPQPSYNLLNMLECLLCQLTADLIKWQEWNVVCSVDRTVDCCSSVGLHVVCVWYIDVV